MANVLTLTLPTFGSELNDAIFVHNWEKVNSLLFSDQFNRLKDCNFNSNGSSCLHFAAQSCNIGVVDYMITVGGMNVNAKNSDGFSALFWVCKIAPFPIHKFAP